MENMDPMAHSSRSSSDAGSIQYTPPLSVSTDRLSTGEVKKSHKVDVGKILGTVLESVKNSSVALSARSFASTLSFKAKNTFDPGTAGSVTALAKDKLNMISGSEAKVRTLQAKAKLLEKLIPADSEKRGQFHNSKVFQKEMTPLYDNLAEHRKTLSNAQKNLREASNAEKQAEIQLQKAEKEEVAAQKEVDNITKKFQGISSLIKPQQDELNKAQDRLAKANEKKNSAETDLKEKTDATYSAIAAFNDSKKNEIKAKKEFDNKARAYDNFLNDTAKEHKLYDHPEYSRLNMNLQSVGSQIRGVVTSASDLIEEQKEKKALSDFYRAYDKKFASQTHALDNAVDKAAISNVRRHIGDVIRTIIEDKQNIVGNEEEKDQHIQAIKTALEKFDEKPSLNNWNALKSAVNKAKLGFEQTDYLKDPLKAKGVEYQEFERALNHHERMQEALNLRSVIASEAKSSYDKLQKERLALRNAEERSGMSMEDALKFRDMTGVWEGDDVPKELQKAIAQFEVVQESFYRYIQTKTTS